MNALLASALVSPEGEEVRDPELFLTIAILSLLTLCREKEMAEKDASI